MFSGNSEKTFKTKTEQKTTTTTTTGELECYGTGVRCNIS